MNIIIDGYDESRYTCALVMVVVIVLAHQLIDHIKRRKTFPSSKIHDGLS